MQRLRALATGALVNTSHSRSRNVNGIVASGSLSIDGLTWATVADNLVSDNANERIIVAGYGGLIVSNDTVTFNGKGWRSSGPYRLGIRAATTPSPARQQFDWHSDAPLSPY